MTPTSKQQCYEMLLMQARPDINTVPLAELISSWQCGQGVMPYNLGLIVAGLAGMMAGAETERRVEARQRA